MPAARVSSALAFVGAHAGTAPPALLARVSAVLTSHPEWEGHPVPEALLEAAQSLLGSVLTPVEAGREVALDLLAADACVTWALEAASDQPQEFSDRAERMMARIAEVAL